MDLEDKNRGDKVKIRRPEDRKIRIFINELKQS